MPAQAAEPDSSPRTEGGRRFGYHLLAVVPLALTALVYRSLPSVYFNADDFLNLYFIVNKTAEEYLLRPHGAHLLVVRNALFYLFFHLFGPEPRFYLWSVLLTHLLNVWLLFVLIRRLTDNQPLAAFGAALWGVCPIHSGTLGWYSVYGQVLVATILLIVLNQAARAATSTRPLPSSAVVVWPLLFLLASTCFGIGIGLTLVSPLLAFLLLPASPIRTRVCLSLAVLAVATPFLYREALRLYEELYGPTAEGLAASIMLERSELSRQWLGMVGFLMTYGLTGLVLGFDGQVGKFPPVAAWVAAGAVLALGVIAFARAPSRTRRQSLALIVIACGCYGIIAAGRSHFFQAETMAAGAAQPRYHYVGSLPFAIGLSLMLAQLFRWARPSVHWTLLGVWAAAAMVPYWRGQFAIDLFPFARKETSIVLHALRTKIAATPPGEDVYIRNQPFRAIGPLYVHNQVTFPGWAALYTIFFPANVVDGKHVYFTVDETLVVSVAKRGKRTADLIVPAESVTESSDW
jgi:hypothetical protein